MRKFRVFLVMVFLFVFLSNAYAIEWIPTNQSTVGWDAVTSLDGENPIPEGDSVSYRIYIRKLPHGEQEVQGDTPSLQYTITFTIEGKFFAGVQTVRIPAGETEEALSVITWSDSTDVVAVPTPFGIRYFVNPSSPKGFEPKVP